MTYEESTPSTESENVSSKLSFSTVASIGIATPATKMELASLADLRAQLRAISSKRDSAKKLEASKLTPRPFFVDMKANIYGILGEPDNIIEDPWNATIAEVSHGIEMVHLEHFNVNRTKADKDIGALCGMFIESLRSRRSIRSYWTDNSNLSEISKLLVATAASEFWKAKLKFDPLVSASQVYAPRVKNESKSQYNARLREFMGRRLNRYHNLLSEALENSFTHKNRREEALSVSFLVREVVRNLPHTTQLETDIRSISKLIPTADMLRRIGKLPDCAIREFKTIFHDSEWNIIKSSKLYKLEEEVKMLVKQPISFDNVESFIERLDRIREEIGQDRLSSRAMSVKKKRLMYASWWKKESARGTPMNPLEEVYRKANDENVLKTFSPFDILIAGEIPLAEEGLSHVAYDKTQKIYYWDVIPNNSGVDPTLLNAAGREFISRLNT